MKEVNIFIEEDSVEKEEEEEERRGTCISCRNGKKSCTNFKKKLSDTSDCTRCSELGIECIKAPRKNRVT